MSKIKIGMEKVVISKCGAHKGKNIHDDLYGGILYAFDGKNETVLITLDSCGFIMDVIDTVKAKINRTTGIKKENIFTQSSHTHADIVFNPKKLGKALSKAVISAKKKAKAAVLGFSRGAVTKKYCVNRRVKIKGVGALTITYNMRTRPDIKTGKVDVYGQVYDFIRYGISLYSPKYKLAGAFADAMTVEISKKQATLLKNLPKKIYLSKNIDPNMDVIYFKGEDKKPIGAIVRIACHPVIFHKSGSTQISADYPGVLTGELSKLIKAPVIFVNGPCGDVKPVYSESGPKETERFGKDLAWEAKKLLNKMSFKPLKRVTFLREAHQYKPWPEFKNLKEAGVNKAFEAAHKAIATPFDPKKVRELIDKGMRLWGGEAFTNKSKNFKLPIYLLGLNDIAFISLPGEIVTKIPLSIYKAFKGKTIVIGALGDGVDTALYVPTKDEFKYGGYEASTCGLVKGSGEKMIEISKKLLKRFFNEQRRKVARI